MRKGDARLVLRSHRQGYRTPPIKGGYAVLRERNDSGFVLPLSRPMERLEHQAPDTLRSVELRWVLPYT